MADVFFSYRNLEDRRKIAIRFATILRAHGITVWWDYGLDAGESYREQITRELSEARLVIPLWCEESIASKWVAMEAELGRDRLFPVRIQRIAPPPEFETIHAAHLESWDGSILHPGFDEVVRDICKRLGKPERLPADTRAELANLPKLKPLPAPKAKSIPKPPPPPRPVVIKTQAAAAPRGHGALLGATVALGVLAAGGVGAAAWLVLNRDALPAVQPAEAVAASQPTPAAPEPVLSNAAQTWTVLDKASPAALRTFLAEHSPSPESELAAGELTLLDAGAWAAAQRENTVASFRAYLDSFPADAAPPGSQAEAAAAAISKLEAPKPKPKREVSAPEPSMDLLVAIAEDLGALHGFRTLCAGDGDQFWRNYMLSFMAYYFPSGPARAPGTDSFNRGFRAQRREGDVCMAETPKAESMRARLLAANSGKVVSDLSAVISATTELDDDGAERLAFMRRIASAADAIAWR